jgi:hypothetical protein
MYTALSFSATNGFACAAIADSFSGGPEKARRFRVDAKGIERRRGFHNATGESEDRTIGWLYAIPTP